jgi:hypothetical protein
MKKASKNEIEIAEEYDFSNGVRGKYLKGYPKGSKLIIIAPDVAEIFPDSKAVNEALRAFIKIARQSQNINLARGEDIAQPSDNQG